MKYHLSLQGLHEKDPQLWAVADYKNYMLLRSSQTFSDEKATKLFEYVKKTALLMKDFKTNYERLASKRKILARKKHMWSYCEDYREAFAELCSALWKTDPR